MPIFRRTYRNYEGEARRRFRWLTIIEQEIRVLLKAKVFVFFLGVSLIHFLFRVLQVVAYDIIMQDPNHPIYPYVKQIKFLVVDEQTFFDYIRLQAPLVFFLLLYAGSGMICNDLRNNLTEIYFSKPMNWRDYLLGKLGTLVAVGLAVTAVPACLIVLLHNLMAPGLATLQTSWWWPLSIIAFSLIMVVPGALAILASSSLIKSESYAGVSVFMLLIADVSMSMILAASLRRLSLHVLNYGLALNRVGELLFRITRPMDTVHPGWATVLIVAVTLLCLVLLIPRIRRAEVPA